VRLLDAIPIEMFPPLELNTSKYHFPVEGYAIDAIAPALPV
jgi:hypothetical protein